MSFRLSRIRGGVLRLVRHRGAAIIIGLVLAVPSAWIQFSGRAEVWWLQGISLVAGATGVALLWAGIVGLGPDWIDRN
jgi:hypothetical protein